MNSLLISVRTIVLRRKQGVWLKAESFVDHRWAKASSMVTSLAIIDRSKLQLSHIAIATLLRLLGLGELFIIN